MLARMTPSIAPPTRRPEPGSRVETRSRVVYVAPHLGPPAGFPASVPMPARLMPIFLCTEQVAVDPFGDETPMAWSWEMDQAVDHTDAITRHFDDLFDDESWLGRHVIDGHKDTYRFFNRRVSVDVDIESTPDGGGQVRVHVRKRAR